VRDAAKSAPCWRLAFPRHVLVLNPTCRRSRNDSRQIPATSPDACPRTTRFWTEHVERAVRSSLREHLCDRDDSDPKVLGRKGGDLFVLGADCRACVAKTPRAREGRNRGSGVGDQEHSRPWGMGSCVEKEPRGGADGRRQAASTARPFSSLKVALSMASPGSSER